LDSGKFAGSEDDLGAPEVRSMLAVALAAQNSASRVFMRGRDCDDLRPMFSSITVYTP
jgi:hypothetical protein